MESERTGLGTTSTVTVLLAPSAVARKVALPGATPVTKPAASTTATAGASEAQLTTTSLRGSPLAARAVALSLTVPPAITGPATGSTSMRARPAGLTVTVAKPGFPPTTATTLISPGWTKVTVPVSSAKAESTGSATQ